MFFLKTNDHSSEQVKHFNYLGCDITHDQDGDLNRRVQKSRNICGATRRNLNWKTRKETQLEFYKTTAAPTLLYDAEAWVIKKKYATKIQSAEMKFLKSVTECTGMDRMMKQAAN
jgi:hypothetical protein